VIRLEHLIYAVVDLEGAARGLRDATGLAALPGGVHPAWGTRNAIVPLGGAYLELVTVADAARAGDSAFGRVVRDGAARAGAALVGFAVAPEDLDAACARAGVDQVRGARERPDGTMLSWSMAGAEEAIPRGLPFFLRWDDPASNPARAAAPHADGVDPVGVAWLSWPASPEEVDAWLGPGHGLPLRHGAPAAAIALSGADELAVDVGSLVA
jgi:Glyoxalase-like domain